MKSEHQRLIDVFRENFDCQEIELNVSVPAQSVGRSVGFKRRFGAYARDVGNFVKDALALLCWSCLFVIGFIFISALPVMTGCWSTNTMSSEVNGRKVMETRAEYGPWGSDLHVKRDTSRYENYKAEIGDMGGAEDGYARERIHAEERTRVWGNTPYVGFYSGCLGQYGMGQAGYCDGRTREYEACINRLGPLPGGEEKRLCMEQIMVHERRSTWSQPGYYGTGNQFYGW